jgi:hypothetical protein
MCVRQDVDGWVRAQLHGKYLVVQPLLGAAFTVVETRALPGLLKALPEK